jgi:hypothetical protein
MSRRVRCTAKVSVEHSSADRPEGVNVATKWPIEASSWPTVCIVPYEQLVGPPVVVSGLRTTPRRLATFRPQGTRHDKHEHVALLQNSPSQSCRQFPGHSPQHLPVPPGALACILAIGSSTRSCAGAAETPARAAETGLLLCLTASNHPG